MNSTNTSQIYSILYELLSLFHLKPNSLKSEIRNENNSKELNLLRKLYDEYIKEENITSIFASLSILFSVIHRVLDKEYHEICNKSEKSIHNLIEGLQVFSKLLSISTFTKIHSLATKDKKVSEEFHRIIICIIIILSLCVDKLLSSTLVASYEMLAISCVDVIQIFCLNHLINFYNPENFQGPILAQLIQLLLQCSNMYSTNPSLSILGLRCLGSLLSDLKHEDWTQYFPGICSGIIRIFKSESASSAINYEAIITLLKSIQIVTADDHPRNKDLLLVINENNSINNNASLNLFKDYLQSKQEMKIQDQVENETQGHQDQFLQWRVDILQRISQFLPKAVLMVWNNQTNKFNRKIMILTELRHLLSNSMIFLGIKSTLYFQIVELLLQGYCDQHSKVRRFSRDTWNSIFSKQLDVQVIFINKASERFLELIQQSQKVYDNQVKLHIPLILTYGMVLLRLDSDMLKSSIQSIDKNVFIKRILPLFTLNSNFSNAYTYEDANTSYVSMNSNKMMNLSSLKLHGDSHDIDNDMASLLRSICVVFGIHNLNSYLIPKFESILRDFDISQNSYLNILSTLRLDTTSHNADADANTNANTLEDMSLMIKDNYEANRDSSIQDLLLHLKRAISIWNLFSYAVFGMIDTKLKQGNDRHNALGNCLPQSCNICGSKNNISVCSRCKSIGYCCLEHQKEDWKKHKVICQTFTDTNLGNTSETIQGNDHLFDDIIDPIKILSTPLDIVLRFEKMKILSIAKTIMKFAKLSLEAYLRLDSFDNLEIRIGYECLLICILECIGNIAFILSDSFTSFAREFIVILLRLAIYDNQVIASNAIKTLHRIALYYTKSSDLKEYLTSCLDRIIDEVSMILITFSDDTSSHKSYIDACNVLDVVLDYIGVSSFTNSIEGNTTTMLLEHMVKATMDHMDRNVKLGFKSSSQMLAIMKLFSVMTIRCIDIPIYSYKTSQSSLKIFQESSVFMKYAFSISMKRRNILELKVNEVHKTLSSSRHQIENDDCLYSPIDIIVQSINDFDMKVRNMLGEEDIELKSSNGNLLLSNENLFELSFANCDIKRLLEIERTLTDVLSKCQYFMSSKILSLQVSTMELMAILFVRFAASYSSIQSINKSIESIDDGNNEDFSSNFLPCVHNTWKTLMNRLSEQRSLFVSRYSKLNPKKEKLAIKQSSKSSVLLDMESRIQDSDVTSLNKTSSRSLELSSSLIFSKNNDYEQVNSHMNPISKVATNSLMKENDSEYSLLLLPPLLVLFDLNVIFSL